MAILSNYIDPRSKIFQHPDRLALLKAGGRPAPVSVEIDLSNRCSLGCEWCHFGYTHTRGLLSGKSEKPAGAIGGGDLMPLELAIKILDELKAAGVLSVTWAGGGEPTLHPNFNEIIELCDLDQGIYTHGGHIDIERASIMKRKMKWGYVSLDCADAQSYHESKGVDYFDRVCEGIKNLVRAEGTATIGLGFLINEKNLHDINLMIDLGLKLGVDYIQFRPTVRYEMAHPNQLAEDTAWMRACLPLLEIASLNDRVIVDIERFRMYKEWQGHGYKICHWAALSTVITPNGSIWTCCNTREHAADYLGSLAEESFKTIWERVKTKPVTESCRVMCRGHIANITLNEIMRVVPHQNFI